MFRPSPSLPLLFSLWLNKKVNLKEKNQELKRNCGLVDIPPKKDVLVWIHDSVLELSTESLGLTGRASAKEEDRLVPFPPRV